MAGGFRDSENIRRANELFQQAYEMGRRSGDSELMVLALCNRTYGDGRAEVGAGVTQRLEEARRLLEQVNEPDADLQSICLMGEATVERELGHSTAAEALLQRARSILEDDEM
jgi:hypothetical protein